MDAGGSWLIRTKGSFFQTQHSGFGFALFRIKRFRKNACPTRTVFGDFKTYGMASLLFMATFYSPLMVSFHYDYHGPQWNLMFMRHLKCNNHSCLNFAVVNLFGLSSLSHRMCHGARKECAPSHWSQREMACLLRDIYQLPRNDLQMYAVDLSILHRALATWCVDKIRQSLTKSHVTSKQIVPTTCDPFLNMKHVVDFYRTFPEKENLEKGNW